MAFFNFGAGIKGFTLTPEGRRYLQALEELKDIKIKVGFQAGDNPYEDGTDVVEVAAFNELGTSDTPARPFMRQSWENHEKELESICKAGVTRITTGGSVEDACKLIGVAGVGLIQTEIVEGNFAPNAPSTIKRKGSSRPLIDTGHMRQSVRYVIKKGE